MSIISQAKSFVQWIEKIAHSPEIERRRCPICHGTHTHKHGTYVRRPWTIRGRRELHIQRYRCLDCQATFSSPHPALIPGSWYARGVQRMALDLWLHLGTSLRRAAEWMRSLMGKQEHWQDWHILSTPPDAAHRCRLCAATIQRWSDRAGERAEALVEGQFAGLPLSKTRLMCADGLWSRLRGGAKRVVLLLVDSVTGVMWPPVVALGEENARAWQMLFAEAQRAGLSLDELWAITSDGAQGLLSYLQQDLRRVYSQRCIWHTWRNLTPLLMREQEPLRQELRVLVRRVLEAVTFEEAEQVLELLHEHSRGEAIWQVLNQRFDSLLAHLLPGFEGLSRVSPEWCWRGFRLRLSRGRNHGSEQRLRRAALVWTIYHNFTPAQLRKEKKRKYRRAGQSPLEVAGLTLEGRSYLDALQV
jgi:transposase-like protein